jgi:hypothetical protein
MKTSLFFYFQILIRPPEPGAKALSDRQLQSRLRFFCFNVSARQAEALAILVARRFLIGGIGNSAGDRPVELLEISPNRIDTRVRHHRIRQADESRPLS